MKPLYFFPKAATHSWEMIVNGCHVKKMLIKLVVAQSINLKVFYWLINEGLMLK